jgi:hypothetical protein
MPDRRTAQAHAGFRNIVQDVMEHGRVADIVENERLAAPMDRLHEYLGA